MSEENDIIYYPSPQIGTIRNKKTGEFCENNVANKEGEYELWNGGQWVPVVCT